MSFYLKEKNKYNGPDDQSNDNTDERKEDKDKVYVVYVNRRFVMIVTQYCRRKLMECL